MTQKQQIEELSEKLEQQAAVQAALLEYLKTTAPAPVADTEPTKAFGNVPNSKPAKAPASKKPAPALVQPEAPTGPRLAPQAKLMDTVIGGSVEFRKDESTFDVVIRGIPLDALTVKDGVKAKLNTVIKGRINETDWISFMLSSRSAGLLKIAESNDERGTA